MCDGLNLWHGCLSNEDMRGRWNIRATPLSVCIQHSPITSPFTTGNQPIKGRSMTFSRRHLSLPSLPLHSLFPLSPFHHSPSFPLLALVLPEGALSLGEPDGAWLPNIIIILCTVSHAVSPKKTAISEQKKVAYVGLHRDRKKTAPLNKML